MAVDFVKTGAPLGVTTATPAPSSVVHAPSAPQSIVPPRVECVEDTGVEPSFIADLILKIVYFHGVIPAGKIGDVLRLPFSGVVDGLIEKLKATHFIEVQGTNGPLPVAYKYALTDKGFHKVQELLRRSNYAGACPVTLEDYTYMVGRQRARDAHVTRARVEEAFSQIVLAPRVLEQLGPAINSGESIFVFGAPGNGKTTIAEIATTCLGGDVYIPHAVIVEGEIIRVFDEAHHRAVQDPHPNTDQRWVRSQRPTVIAGGELTLGALDLTYSQESKVYEAPLQMKANGGMFLIDDFGRQQCSPTALLNRWIVPLEKHVDYLNMVTGTKIKVPFEELIVFSTNLSPKDLVDDAFLRRMQYKIEVLPPTPDQFQAIFKRVALAKGIEYVEEAFQYLMIEHYEKHGREPQACHPRDLLNHLISAARYYDVRPALRKDLIDFACRSYFVRLQ
ncbi:MAG TPA: ATP-binding protein [Chloroflexota bacterium]|nr:ATP-binding protein [Chloroflexota bacterium]